MKLFSLVILSLAIANVGAEDIFSSDAWKRSLATDAPVIDPSETYELLKKLEPLVENDTIKKNELAVLINYSHTETKKGLCYDSEFNFMFHITKGTNSISSPKRNSAYGPNIMAYIQNSRENVLKMCADMLWHRYQRDFADSTLNTLNYLKKNVFPNKFVGSGSELKQLNENSDVLVNGIVDYIKEAGQAVDKDTFITEFNSIKYMCERIVKSGKDSSIGFIDVALNREDLSGYVLSEPLINKLAVTDKICTIIKDSSDDFVAKVAQKAGFTIAVKKHLKDKLKNLLQ